MPTVVVTGGSGKTGSAVIRELLAHGWQVLNVDVAAPREPLCQWLKADLTDMGQAVDAIRRPPGMVDRRRGPLGDAEAVIHLAGITAPALLPDAVTFQTNLMSTYNVFNAALRFGLRRVVYMSSETVFGLPFTRTPPQFAPVTEDHPVVPESGYAFGKCMTEDMARQMNRWCPDVSFIGFRLSNVFDDKDSAEIPSFWADPATRKWNLWSWVDARDVAQACRLALEAPLSGADVFTIAAADTLMRETNAELMARYYPDVPIRGEIGTHDTLLSIDKARRLLGYAPRHTWRV